MKGSRHEDDEETHDDASHKGALTQSRRGGLDVALLRRERVRKGRANVTRRCHVDDTGDEVHDAEVCKEHDG